MDTKNLLIELGTEELPPKSLRKLAEAFHSEFVKRLAIQDLKYSSTKWFATPRRLALQILDLQTKQEDKTVEIKGPSIKVAFDENNQPTKAAIGWANANNIDIKDIQIITTDKGSWIGFQKLQSGQETTSLIENMVKESLASLPIPKLMHWGSKRVEFVRPVHTLTILFNDKIVKANILDLNSSRIVKGHRFLGKQEFEIKDANSYEDQLLNEGLVIADYEKRKAKIKEQVIALSDSVNGVADLDEDLLEEVTSLVEYPTAYIASFEERFLQVPSEALVYTMKGDQKYFPLYDKEGKLLPKFIFISNIKPENTKSLISGNERVVRPRLSDAQFFFNTDRKKKLEDYFKTLETVVYQKDIGTIAYRTSVVQEVAKYIAKEICANEALADRAAYLAKCDLATTLVNEFTDTQGIMGMHYARLDGENNDVADAIFEQYLPRFAGDIIPTKGVQISVSLAEKIVTLVGIFGINLLPKGDKDPYGLRRAAIGIIRILIENKLDLNIHDTLKFCASILKDKIKNENTLDQLVEYIYTRLKAYYQDQNIGSEIYTAVLANRPVSLFDFDKRVKALVNFKTLDVAIALASAYKRVNNILSKVDIKQENITEELLVKQEEKDLVNNINNIEEEISNLYKDGKYTEAMTLLATLKDVIDNFFEKVIVNDEDENIKNNRIAILNKIQNLFKVTGDISVLY